MTHDSPETTTNSSNWLKWLGIGCGGCLLVSVVAFLGLGFAASRLFKSMNLEVEMEPEKSAAKAETIFDYQFPGAKVVGICLVYLNA